MAETLYISSTRKSPYSLSDIGYKDGDLTTIQALSEDLARAGIPSKYIPIAWIKAYARDNGEEIAEILNNMMDAYRD